VYVVLFFPLPRVTTSTATRKPCSVPRILGFENAPPSAETSPSERAAMPHAWFAAPRCFDAYATAAAMPPSTRKMKKQSNPSLPDQRTLSQT